MNQNQLVEKIIELLKANLEDLNNVALLPNTPLIVTGLISSFDIIELLSILEVTFSIELKMDEINLANFETPALIAKLVAEHQNSACDYHVG
jgi:acyl carrier protein